MIETYKNSNNGKIKVFFVTDENDKVTSVKTGNRVVPIESGYQFYVDKHVAHQMDKINLIFTEGKPKLKVKDGEAIEKPEKIEKEKEIERLEQELEELKNAK